MNWPILPFLLPLMTAVVCLFWGRPSRSRRWWFASSALFQFFVALGLSVQVWGGQIQVLGLGAWSSRLGIVLVVDLLSAVMMTLVSLVVMVSIVYGFFESRLRIENPLRLPLIQLMVAGVQLALCTGDLFNLFVSFEIMLVASYALLTLEADDWDIKQAFPYVAVNVFGSAVFICACGLAYGMFGTLNFAELARQSSALAGDVRLIVLAGLLFVVFGIKAGMFPLHFWLPNSYPTLPIPLLALFGGVLTKVGVYAMIRLFCTFMPSAAPSFSGVFGWLALITAIVGGMGAISRPFIRGILSFHIISQVGLMLLALSFMTPLGVAAALMIVWHNLIVKSSLFLIGGTAAMVNRTDDLSKMGHLWRVTPWLGVIFLLQALSLAGIPPLSGFWGKYALMQAGIESGAFALVGGSIVVSLLTLFSMVKIWLATFWSAPQDMIVSVRDHRPVRLGWVVSVLVVVALGFGFGAEGFSRVALRAADQVLTNGAYVEAVLGHSGKSDIPISKEEAQ